jgi:hypothetical protein
MTVEKRQQGEVGVQLTLHLFMDKLQVDATFGKLQAVMKTLYLLTELTTVGVDVMEVTKNLNRT